MLVIPELRIGYQNIPKAASTSMFAWLYRCLNGEQPAPQDGGDASASRIHAWFNDKNNPRFTRCPSNQFTAAGHEGYLTFALTRDPVRRFISMYSNRVIFHRELSKRSRIATTLEKSGLRFNPDINLLVENFDAYAAIQDSVRHHARPMIDFLGRDMSIYTRIADISDFPQVVAEVRAHFVANGFADVARIEPPAERHQAGGPKLGLAVLNPHSFETLLERYKDDYANIPTLDIRAITDEYHKARKEAQAEIRVKVDAALAGARKGKEKRKLAKGEEGAAAKTRGAKPAGGAKGGKKGGKKAALNAAGVAAAAGGKAGANKKKPGKKKPAARAVSYPEAAQVAKARVNPIAARAKGPRPVSGVLVLDAALVAGDWQLAATVGDKAVPVTWGMPSPAAASKFTDNPNAASARFKLAEPAAADQEVVIELLGKSGTRVEVARVAAATAAASESAT